MEQNFDFQFTSEEDIQHLLDGFVEGMQDMVAEDEGKTTIINPLRLAQIKFTYSVMKYLTRDTDAEVTYKLNEPFKTRCWSLRAPSGLRERRSSQATPRYTRWRRTAFA